MCGTCSQGTPPSSSIALYRAIRSLSLVADVIGILYVDEYPVVKLKGKNEKR